MAISDWEDVVAKWGKKDCKTSKDRIDAAAEVQADPENEKPGDKLVEHLADLLDRWHELPKSTRWHDDFARDSWQRHIAPRLVGVELPENADDMTAALRKAVRAKHGTATSLICTIIC